MRGKKIIFLIAGAVGVLASVAVFIAGVTGAAIPKPLLIAFSAACMANAVLLLLNARKK